VSDASITTDGAVSRATPRHGVDVVVATAPRGVLDLVLWTVAGAVLAGWFALAVIHRADEYRVSHVQGVWMAAVEEARAGRLYPPLVDGEYYAGTRYMPLPILLNAAASAAVGDPLEGGKVLAATLMLILLSLVVFVLRRLSCPWPLAAGLAAVIVGTNTGLQAGTTIGGDLLPVVLQVGALAAVLGARRPSYMLAAGVLAGLAVVSKLTGVWAFLAIVTWLVWNGRWRPAITFAIACAVTAGSVLAAVQLVSSGGLFTHLRTFSFAGVHTGYLVLRGPNQILYNLIGHALGTVVLLPLAAVGVLQRHRWQSASLVHIALGYTLLLLVVVYSDIGTGFNQLVDLVVLTSLAVGALAGTQTAADAAPATRGLLLVVMVAVVWAAGLDLVRTVGLDIRAALASRHSGAVRRSTLMVSDMVTPGDEVLAEDPALYVALHRRPLVADPFMLRVIEHEHPEWLDPLIGRITSRRFNLVVLVVPVEDRRFDYWWNDFHYGRRVAAALRASYQPMGTVGRYFVYRPR
jgi:hypothetical protein